MLLTAPPASLPTHFYVPEGARFTLAEEIGDLMSQVGYQVDEPERMACRALFAQQANGDWMGLDSGIVCPRQNLKTAIEIAGALHDTFVQGVAVAWTAHEYKTSSEAFRDFQAVIEGHDWLAAEVLKVRTANGDEGFNLRNGARLDILARTGKSGRGMSRPRLYLDEGGYLDAKIMGAIVPTMSAMPNAHMVVGSSPGLQSSVILRGMRTRGRSGTDPHIGWIEWSQPQGDCATPDCEHTPGTEGCWLDDMDAVLAVNPAAPRRISMEYLAQERLTLASAPIEYLRERMGVWEDPPADGSGVVFPTEDWTACRDTVSEIPEDAPTVWSVDVSFDRAAAHLIVFGAGQDGIPHGIVRWSGDPSDLITFMESPEGISGRGPCRGIAVQANGAPASSMIPDLQRAFPDLVVPIAGADISKACGYAHDAVTSHRVRHRGQSQIDRALAVAEVRSLSDGWALDRKRSRLDIAPLVAWVNGLWLYQTFEAEPEPQGFFITT